MVELNVIQPSSVTLMIKPVGALCNLDCEYCYYLPTKSVYDGHESRMSLATLESIFASYLPVAADEVTICWQGGEPTLAGIGFFEKALEYQDKHKRPSQKIANAIQTNGTLLNDDWCELLRRHGFLVGISIDGPPHFHDHYRRTNGGAGSHDKVAAGLRLLQRHGVEYNILCVLNDRNVGHPDDVFGYLLNLGSRWLQFIPEIVWESDPDRPGATHLASHCPDALAYGKFMTRVFDQWFERYRQRVSVRLFDAALGKLVTGQMPLCILDGACSGQLTIEHNGDVFGCDHFVERRWQLTTIGDERWTNPIDAAGDEQPGLTIHGTGYLGNAHHGGRDIGGLDDVEARYAAATVEPESEAVDLTWFKRADAERLGQFSARKQDLPEKCVACQWKQHCYGGCPEHRPGGGDDPAASVLCEGYIYFYEHCMERLEWLAGYLGRGMQPPAVQRNVEAGAATDSSVGRRMIVPAAGRARRNDPCPCGSGLKFKQCCAK